MAIVAGLVLVPLVDQTIKRVVFRRIGSAALSLGPIGQMRLERSPIWMVRATGRSSLRLMWAAWILAAGTLVIVSTRNLSSGWCAGLLLGGSLSHAVEMSVQGSVCDYISLRFWPSFNLADVALTIGAAGLVAQLV